MRILGRRDVSLTADWFQFDIDPYHDRRTGYYFALSAAGTMQDGTLLNDEWNDNSWDEVWEGRTVIDDHGLVFRFKSFRRPAHGPSSPSSAKNTLTMHARTDTFSGCLSLPDHRGPATGRHSIFSRQRFDRAAWAQPQITCFDDRMLLQWAGDERERTMTAASTT